MRLISVNIGQPTVLDPERPTKRTGIVKRPVEGTVRVGQLGLDGDAVLDRKHHGGPGQAVYLYSMDDYAWWAEQGVESGPGVFGENLTVSGVTSSQLCIGDRLAIGSDVVLEVTSCRIPCATLAKRMADPHFVKKFRDAARPGAYLRVIAEGAIAPGMDIALEPYEGDRLPMDQHFAISFEKNPARETIERLLALPLAERDRADTLDRLNKLNRM